MDLLTAGMITIVSMLIVFLVLTCLMFAVNIIHKLLSGGDHQDG